MGRSQGRGTTVALLAASGCLLTSQFSAFVGQSASSGRNLRVSLAASQADVETAEKEFRLKSWAAAHLAGEGSPQAAAAAMRAQQAEAAYMAVKAQFDGQALPVAAAPAAPVAAAPVAVAPMPAAPVATSAVSKEELAAAKSSAQLLTWSANKLMSEGAPQAAAMKAKADQAVAAFEAMKQAEASGVAAPAVPAPVAAAPVAAAPAVVAAAAPVASAVSKEELAAAKSNAQLLSWAANKLMSEGAPQAAAMKSKADQAVAAFEAMKQAEATGGAAPAAPVAPVLAAPVAAAPVAPAPVAAAPMVSSAPSAEEVLKAKKEMELHEWAAEKLASSGSLQAAVMKAKAEQSRQAYEALVAAQDKQLVAR